MEESFCIFDSVVFGMHNYVVLCKKKQLVYQSMSVVTFPSELP